MHWFESQWQDFRHGARLLRMNPVFFAVAAVSLALGIGANAAIFQLLDAVVLRMLPIPHPEQIAEIKIADNEHCCNGNFSAHFSNFTYAQWEQIRNHAQAFSGLFAWGDRRFNLADEREARMADGLWVSGQFFSTLGVRPVAGRLISEDDDRAGCGGSSEPGAVISYAFWQREFGGDRQAIGKKLSLDGHPVPVIGITSPGFFGLEVGHNFDIAVPICAEPWIDGERSHLAKRITGGWRSTAG